MASNASALFKRPLYVYDLPPELLETLYLRLDTDAPLADLPSEEQKVTSLPHDTSSPASGLGDGTGSLKAISCGLCGLAFPNVLEQRVHVRSDLHGYNTKQRIRGGNAVSEQEFERLVKDLDESLSGSESEGSESESEGESAVPSSKTDGTKLAALLQKHANISEEDEDVGTRKRKRGAGKPPLIWFGTPKLPSNTSLGVYRSLFSKQEQQIDSVEVLRQKQLSPTQPAKHVDDEGGVALPKTDVGPHVFMCMVGGGHFAAMIVALTPKIGKKGGLDERQASVVAHKTFHRYTTRRKQGGAQSANDMSKGNAHSAGASIRRYNEDALLKEIRDLLTEWKDLISTSDLHFIRASGSTNRRTLFGPYDGQVLQQNDPRVRGFPFSTRRATQAELMRCFVELTRVKIREVDEAAIAAAAAKAAQEDGARAAIAASKRQASAEKATKAPRDEVSETASLHTTQLEALIRRSKAPALLSYLTTNSLPADFRLYPQDTPQHHHVPTPLHMASSANSPALVQALLVRAGADPTLPNADGKTAFELAGDRATRDAFRLARSELGERRWDWIKAGVADALSKKDVEERAAREKTETDVAERERRAGELERLKEEELRREKQKEDGKNERRDRKMGKGVMLGEKMRTAEERREEEGRGMTDEMRRRLEREKRARAAEARFGRVQQGAGR